MSLKKQLEEAVDQLGDEYGSECTSGGKVYETRATTLKEALPASLGLIGTDPDFDEKEWIRFVKEGAKIVPFPYEDFIEASAGERHADFIGLLDGRVMEYAKVGEHDYDPESDTPGLFFYVLLVRDTETNFLVAFPCVWT